MKLKAREVMEVFIQRLNILIQLENLTSVKPDIGHNVG